MEKYWYLFGGLLVGFLICYLICKQENDGGAMFECAKEQHIVQYCLDSLTLGSNSIANLDATMNNYYKEAFLYGDSIGFSMDRNLILGLAQYIDKDAQSYGIRLYPGLQGTTKFVIIKPLDNQGNERSNLGNYLNVSGSITGFSGPCPKWCGQAGRIIIYPPISG